MLTLSLWYLHCSPASFLTLTVSTSISFFFDAPATTEIYTLSLHDALPIFRYEATKLTLTKVASPALHKAIAVDSVRTEQLGDRKSTRLNSSHTVISYAVFCLKKKKKINRVSMQNSNTKQQTIRQNTQYQVPC